MANYTHTQVLNLTPEMKISLAEILNSDKYYFRYKDVDNNFFDTNVRTAYEVICELSRLYPAYEIMTESRYESYHYLGVFTEFFKNGESIREEVRMDYYFEWAAEIDEKLKEHIEEEFTNHFNKFEKLITEPDISHSIIMGNKKYKEITNKNIYNPIEYKGIKQGPQIFVSIGFLFQSETIDTNNEEIETIDNAADTNSEGFCPIDDDNDLPF